MKVKEKINTSELIENLESEVIEKKKTRDYSVDLIRIIACFMVIGTHLALQVLNPCFNRIDWSRLLEKSFVTDGVPIFFLITGFFIANGRSYKKIWKSTFFKILLPTFIYIIFVQIFSQFILNKESIGWCIKNIFINLNLFNIIKSILVGDFTIISALCTHLWYIFSYIKIIIWVPIIWLLCKEENGSKLARKIVLIFGIIGMVISDIQRFIVIPSIEKIHIFELVDKEILYVLLGYELFTYKDKIKNNKKACIISGILFIIINFIRYKLEMQYMVINSYVDIIGRETFIDWRYTIISVISAISLFTCIYSFEIKSDKIGKFLVWISDKTFGIYLIHYLVLAKIDLYKFEIIEKFYLEILYLVLGMIITFTISIILTYILKKIKELVIFSCKAFSTNK